MRHLMIGLFLWLSLLSGCDLGEGDSGGIPWVLTVDDERVYLGAFWYAYSSLMPQVPYIDILIEPHRIRRDYSDGTQSDQRADPRIYRVLKNAGVLVE